MPRIISDVSNDELSEVNARIARLLAKWGTLPWYSIQYRLGEVSNRRIEPRLLRRSLAELANNRRPRRGALRSQGPTEAVKGIFSHPDLPRQEAESQAERVSEGLLRVAGSTVRLLDPTLCVPQHFELSDVTSRSTGRTVGGITFDAVDTICSIASEGRPVRMWLTHDLEWIYPDDHRLWRLLIDCARDGHRPLIVARKLAPPTFVLLKTLGIDGAQYYSSLIQPEQIDAVRAAIEDMAWFHSKSSLGLRGHPVRDRVGQLVLRNDGTWDAASNKLLQVDAHDFMASGQEMPEHFLDWLDTVGLRMPARWVSTVARWGMFRDYGTAKQRRTKNISAPSAMDSHSETPITKHPESPEPEKAPPATAIPATATSESPRGFGRQTQKTRIPLRLR